MTSKVYSISNKPLNAEEVRAILKNFDPAKHNHTDLIYQVESGQVYIFFSQDQKKLCNYTNDYYSFTLGYTMVLKKYYQLTTQ
jgi:hypothetical protein